MPGLERSDYSSIKKLLKSFPCVAIIGARQSGKSFLLKQIFPSSKIYDFEDEDDLNLVASSPKTFIESSKCPLIIDEVQLYPDIFRALRVSIDKHRETNGRFLITGSSSPELLKNISESLAGRVVIIELNNLTLKEAYQNNKPGIIDKISDIQELKKLKRKYSQADLDELIFYGQYPEPFLKRKKQGFQKLWMKNYFKTYIERDIRGLFPHLRLESFKKFIKMLAFASGNPVNLSDLSKSLDVSQPTVKNYIEIAEGTFLWRSLKPYESNINKRIVRTPKGYLRDTGLINFSLGIHSIEELKSHPKYGVIWEIFIIEEIIKGLQSKLSNDEFHYLRTKNKAEIDLIIEGESGLIPIEVKAGTSTDPRKLAALKNFVVDTKAAFGILINNSDELRMISPEIMQVPAAFI
jgi:predicted AAA+ superfamily ATPase